MLTLKPADMYADKIGMTESPHKSYDNSWQYVENLHRFFRQTDILRDTLDFEGLSVSPLHPLGHFKPEQLAELLAFCKEHPQFHIMTFTERGIYYNTVVGSACSYFLCKGDKNPKLAHDPGPIPIGDILKIAEFYKC